MKKLRSVTAMKCEGRRVFVRVDFNEPMKGKKILDDHRMRAAIPTIKWLIKNKARVILATHVGRPKGKTPKLSTAPHAKLLSKLLKAKVSHVSDCIGATVERKVARLRDGEVLLLENLRFYTEEKKNNKKFAQKLARLADAYVNEAFSNSHRAHASMAAITDYLPSFAGLRLIEEVATLSALTKPKQPFVAILGGAKVSDKIEVIHELAKNAKTILIAGAMMFTFLKSQGVAIGSSKHEADKLDVAKSLLKKYGRKIVLPVDVRVAKTPADRSRMVDISSMPESMMGLDIGEKTSELFAKKCKSAKTVFWNGPLGLVEEPRFAKGTKNLARALAKLSANRIVGGGDSAAFLRKSRMASTVDFMSTGGGAALSFVAKKPMPGLSPLWVR